MPKGHSAVTRRTALAAGGAGLLVGCTAGAQPEATARRSRWSPGPALPHPVQEIYPAALGGRIHLAGGFLAQNGQITGPTDAHWSLAPGEQAWRAHAALPEPRHHPNLVALGDRLYALGGFRTDGSDAVWVMRDQTWVFDPNGDAWTEAAPAPAPHGETVCAALGDRIHVAGGRRPSGETNASWNDHRDVADHLVFEPAENRWETAAPALSARNSAAGAVIDGAWHVVGGRVVNDGNRADHEVYDAREDRWRRAAPMPQAQGGLAAAALNGQLYAFGGEWFAPAGGGVHEECWAYEPAQDAWTLVAEGWTPRHGLGAVTLGESIYVIGGARLVGGNGASELVEIFEA